MENLTAYIQQWSSPEELLTMSLVLPQLFYKDHIDKLERRKNWTKAKEDWFQHVLYNGNMGISHVVRIANKFLKVQKVLKGIRKFYTDFLELYTITYPKLEAILKIPNGSWEKEFSLVEGDHWLRETWKLSLDHRKKVLE